MILTKRIKPFIKDKKVVAQSKLFTIEQLDLKFANGVERIYERVCSTKSAVIVVAINAANNLLLIREYAAGIDDYELAFPKGIIEKNESPLDAANRELQEEVGFGARQLTYLKSMTLAPGYFSARMELVVARELYPQILLGDEPEPIEVIEWPLSAYQELLDNPLFSEARSIAALLLVKQWLEKEKNNE